MNEQREKVEREAHKLKEMTEALRRLSNTLNRKESRESHASAMFQHQTPRPLFDARAVHPAGPAGAAVPRRLCRRQAAGGHIGGRVQLGRVYGPAGSRAPHQAGGAGGAADGVFAVN